MTRDDLNNDRGYLLGYARNMLMLAHNASTARVKSIWLAAAHNARVKAQSAGPVQRELFS